MGELRVQVIATGASPEPIVATTADLVIAADGGLDAAVPAGRLPDVVVGDLDSVSPAALAGLGDGVAVERAAADKDETDLELALEAATGRGATSITVHLAADGRLDHQLANLVVLASPRWRSAAVVAHIGDHDRVYVVHNRRTIPLEKGDPFAVVPIGGPATVTTHGVRWELSAEVLDATAARGISNVVTSAGPIVQVDGGVVLVLSSAHAT